MPSKTKVSVQIPVGCLTDHNNHEGSEREITLEITRIKHCL